MKKQIMGQRWPAQSVHIARQASSYLLPVHKKAARTGSTFLSLLLVLTAALLPATVSGTDRPIPSQTLDPLNSPSWVQMHAHVLNNEPVVFDDLLTLHVPESAENPAHVPISVTLTQDVAIEEIRLFADLNPVKEMVYFKPLRVRPYLAFRFKIEQPSPVRAAAKTADGVWHVTGKWVDAAGGGCTAPSEGRVKGDWHETLMDVATRSWYNDGQLQRFRMRVMHPMDTGFAPGIPAFYVEELTLTDEQENVLAKLDVFQPVSENPVFTFDLFTELAVESVQLTGRDNNGNKLEARLK